MLDASLREPPVGGASHLRPVGAAALAAAPERFEPGPSPGLGRPPRHQCCRARRSRRRWPRTTLPSQRPCSGVGRCSRCRSWSLTAASLARIRLAMVMRLTQNRPFLAFPQMWVKREPPWVLLRLVIGFQPVPGRCVGQRRPPRTTLGGRRRGSRGAAGCCARGPIRGLSQLDLLHGAPRPLVPTADQLGLVSTGRRRSGGRRWRARATPTCG